MQQKTGSFQDIEHEHKMPFIWRSIGHHRCRPEAPSHPKKTGKLIIREYCLHFKKESYPKSFHGVQCPLIQDGTDQGVHL